MTWKLNTSINKTKNYKMQNSKLFIKEMQNYKNQRNINNTKMEIGSKNCFKDLKLKKN